MREDERFYVYLHRRSTDGEIFYVGKGCGNRAYQKGSARRNEHWKRVVNKYGHTVEIISCLMTNARACNLEIRVISFCRALGIPLINKTAGGEGCLERKFTEKEREALRNRKCIKTVYCSNGVVYKSISEAARQLSLLTGKPVHSGWVSTVCSGRQKTIHGYAVSFEGFPETPTLYGNSAKSDAMKKALSKKIFRSDGVTYNSVADAVRDMFGEATKCRISNISMCARGERSSAYGYKWSYAETC